jgi:hypothetical protein
MGAAVARVERLRLRVKINGAMQSIMPGASCASRGADGAHEELRTEVISRWPGFHRYVEQLVKIAVDKVQGHGPTSAEVRMFCCSKASIDNPYFMMPCFRVDTPTWCDLPLARSYYKHSPMEWFDDKNVCNDVRLRIILIELGRLGFETSVRHTCSDITLRIGVPPARVGADSISTVKIHGVDVAPDQA